MPDQSSNYAVWVVGMKGWVKVREGRSLPTPVEETVEVLTKKRVIQAYGHWDYITNGYTRDRYQTVNRMVNLKQKVWKGGRHRATISSKDFEKVTGMKIGVDEMVELAPSTIEKVRTFLKESRHADK